MKKYLFILIILGLLGATLSYADFTIPGKQMLIFNAAERQSKILDRRLNDIISIGAAMDKIKLQAGKIGVSEATKLQSAYIDAMKTKITDVATTWVAAR